MAVIWTPGPLATDGADRGVSNGVGPGDSLNGLGGNDTLVGNVGADTIFGGLDGDTISGGAGDDKLYGNTFRVSTDSASNTIYGGAGTDEIRLSQFGDKAYGGADRDFIIGAGNGRDTIFGGIGNGIGSGDDYIRSGSGDDIVQGEDGNDNIGGSNGNDALYGQANDDTLTGGIGGDQLYGGPGDDSLSGDSDDDLLNGGGGKDTLRGSSGNDKFVFAFSHSSVSAFDRISDFAIDNDKIDLLTAGGVALPAPDKFTRAADNLIAPTLQDLVNSVFDDANGAPGVQQLGINAAALVVNKKWPFGGTYLIINDSELGFNRVSDLVINITGYTGMLPDVGAIPDVGSFFV